MSEKLKKLSERTDEFIAQLQAHGIEFDGLIVAIRTEGDDGSTTVCTRCRQNVAISKTLHKIADDVTNQLESLFPTDTAEEIKN